MKHSDKASVYATNKAGKISAPRPTAKGDPKVTKTQGEDLRVKPKKA